MIARLLLGIALALAAASVANAQSWPQRAVRIIVPLPAGSAVDVTSRLLAERLTQKWGQGVVVENRLGADGTIAVNSFLAARDDHQLLVSFGGVVTLNPIINKSLSYDPGELAPISVLVDNFLGIAASATTKTPRFADFVALAKASPGQYSWAATPGQTAVIMPALLKAAGIDLVKVNYSNFSVALQDLVQGRLHIVATSLPALQPLAQSGSIDLLMVTNGERAPQQPGVPTAAEAGYPQLTFPGSVVLFGAKDIPQARRAQIAADIAAAAHEPAVRGRLENLGISVRARTVDDAISELAGQRQRLEAALKLLD
jgi:tripartite-type tricarboxylate transporter receptor subunit TctC